MVFTISLMLQMTDSYCTIYPLYIYHIGSDHFAMLINKDILTYIKGFNMC